MNFMIQTTLFDFCLSEPQALNLVLREYGKITYIAAHSSLYIRIFATPDAT